MINIKYIMLNTIFVIKKSFMRIVKNILAIVFIALSSVILTRFVNESGNLVIIYILTGFIVLIFSFNLYARNHLRYKSYFTNQLNVFAAKTSGSISTDIPIESILDKLQEVLRENGWKIKEINEQDGEILATTGISFRSWGENIYCEVLEGKLESEIKFHSVGLFQIHMWGKNEDNLEAFISKFEDSLIV